MSSATMPLLDDDTVAFGDEENIPKNGALVHPYVTFFHLAFRGASIVVYLLCDVFGDSFIASFVTVMLLLSMDFWTVKNITGRLMVGLRWWNYVDDDGNSHWVYESKKGGQQNRVNDREASIFWLTLILTPLLWSVFFFSSLLKFNLKWLLLVVIALILNGANLYGYIKCKIGNSESITTATTDFFRKQVLLGAVSSMMTKKPEKNDNPPSNVV